MESGPLGIDFRRNPYLARAFDFSWFDVPLARWATEQEPPAVLNDAAGQGKQIEEMATHA